MNSFFRAVRGIVVLLCLSNCVPPDTEAPSGRVAVEVWYHAGRESERMVLEDQARRFNDSQDSIHVSLVFIPEGSYSAMVQASGVAGQLPDLLDLDGPYLASFAWQGHLRPLDGLLSDQVVANLLPTIVSQGTYNGELYGVGTFDSGLGLYASRTALEAVQARVSTAEDGEAWSLEELEGVLERLSESDSDGAVLDLKLNFSGEWFTFAFLPVISSAGGGLVRGEPPRASGTLDSLESISALHRVQSWMRRGLVDPNLDDRAFIEGRVALSWGGHWDYPRYFDALGDDLVVLPLPDFGTGAKTGQGSWVWTVPRSTDRPRAAAAFLQFLLRPEEVLAMAQANGAVPGTLMAALRSELYGPGGPLSLFLEQLTGGHAVPRPRTPAYPVLSSLFQAAFDEIREGGAVDEALRTAAAAADREIADNEGYPSL